MIAFGNDDPEDAWSTGDPLPERLALLVRIIAAIHAEFGVLGDTPRHRARLIGLVRLVEDVADG